MCGEEELSFVSIVGCPLCPCLEDSWTESFFSRERWEEVVRSVATAELCGCVVPGKPTMSTNKTKKVKMATKSCPECDQQVRQHIFPNWAADAFGFVWLTAVPHVINDAQLEDKNGACWLHTCKH